MSESPEKRGRGWETLGIVVLLLVLYPLSIGPAIWITHAFKKKANWVFVAYKPVLWLAGRSSYTSDAITWYMNLDVPRSPTEEHPYWGKPARRALLELDHI